MLLPATAWLESARRKCRPAAPASCPLLLVGAQFLKNERVGGAG